MWFDTYGGRKPDFFMARVDVEDEIRSRYLKKEEDEFKKFQEFFLKMLLFHPEKANLYNYTEVKEETKGKAHLNHGHLQEQLYSEGKNQVPLMKSKHFLPVKHFLLMKFYPEYFRV